VLTPTVGDCSCRCARGRLDAAAEGADGEAGHGAEAVVEQFLEEAEAEEEEAEGESDDEQQRAQGGSIAGPAAALSLPGAIPPSPEASEQAATMMRSGVSFSDGTRPGTSEGLARPTLQLGAPAAAASSSASADGGGGGGGLAPPPHGRMGSAYLPPRPISSNFKSLFARPTTAGASASAPAPAPAEACASPRWAAHITRMSSSVVCPDLARDRERAEHGGSGSGSGSDDDELGGRGSGLPPAPGAGAQGPAAADDDDDDDGGGAEADVSALVVAVDRDQDREEKQSERLMSAIHQKIGQTSAMHFLAGA
jgi:hypothetical protein